MTSSANIEIKFIDFWHAGTGSTGRGDADMVTYRDAWGCPAMPMSQVKGILRDTAETFGVLNEDECDKYFGQRAKDGVHVTGESAISFVGDALLSNPQRNWLGDASNKIYRKILFSNQKSTAIDQATGTAKNDTLRSIEVVVPVTLTQTVTWLRGDAPEDWIKNLDTICALTPALGKAVHDGMGRAIITCKAVV